MKKTLLITALSAGAVAVATNAYAGVDPEKDRKQLVEFIMAKAPNIPFEDYRLGAYIYNAGKKEQYDAVNDFPPYLDHIDAGEVLWEKDKAIYEKCFGSDISQIRPKYPYFDDKRGEVVTLELAINECRKNAGLKPFKWAKGDIAKLSAYLAYNARGQKIHVTINSEGAKKAYEAGRELFTKPHGQLNLSCAKCHVYNASRRARANILSPALGHTTHFPVYRAKWSDLGTLHRRYTGCMKNMRWDPKTVGGPQSVAFRNLEFFEAYLSNGLEIDGPDYRE
jgi:sulfur-oxidizing protein SoxA